MDIDYGDFTTGEGGGSRRKARLESFLKREIATTVNQELRDPRLGFITITRCELTPDFSQVTAYYTLLEGGKRIGLVQNALNRATRFIQGRYAKHLRMRRLPHLTFCYDEAIKRQNEMEDLIRRARASDPDGGRAPDADEDDQA